MTKNQNRRMTGDVHSWPMMVIREDVSRIDRVARIQATINSAVEIICDQVNVPFRRVIKHKGKSLYERSG